MGAVLVGAIGLTVALYTIPGGRTVATPLLWLSTFAHELGHAVAAWLVGGQVSSLMVFPDGSGVLSWRMSGESGLRRAFVAAGGLLGPPTCAAVMFVCARQASHARWALQITSVLAVLLTMAIVRNVFGVVFVLALALALGVAARKLSAVSVRLLLAFLAVQLSLSVFSRADYLFVSTANTGSGQMPSDVAQISLAIGLPHWFWGLVCGGFSVVVLGFGLRTSLR